MSPRLVTLDGQLVAPIVQTVAFAAVDGEMAATINGQDANFVEALFKLVCMMHGRITADDLTARAISEPGGLR